MPRVTTAYVSKYQLDRVKETHLYRTAKVTFTCNFNGATGSEITSATWYTTAPWSTVFSNPAIAANGKSTSVVIQAALPDWSNVKCQVTLADGSVLNQNWRIRVNDAPWYGNEQIPAAGPDSVTVTA